VLAVSSHLTERDRDLVRLVGEHRVLITDQLAALRFDNIITARHRLSLLVRIGMLRRFPATPRGRVGAVALPARPGRRRAAERGGPE